MPPLQSFARSWVAVLSLLAGTTASAQPPRFPVPRAEGEFRELMPFARGFGGQNRGDLEMFRRWSLP